VTAYRDLGPTAMLTAKPDTTGSNTGNWTLTATEQDLNVKVGQAEIYQISIDGPVGSSFTVYRNRVRWNTVLQGWANSWDPSNPLYLRQGDSLFLYWNAAISIMPAPTAVFWIKYDTDLPENRGY
jgi:hypothetical protein